MVVVWWCDGTTPGTGGTWYRKIGQAIPGIVRRNNVVTRTYNLLYIIYLASILLQSDSTGRLGEWGVYRY